MIAAARPWTFHDRTRAHTKPPHPQKLGRVPYIRNFRWASLRCDAVTAGSRNQAPTTSLAMKLYHYTAASMGEAILTEGLTKGHLLHGDDSIRQDLVWFTTDPSHEHHGLTLGTEALTPRHVAYQQRLSPTPLRNARTLNKTQLRITVEIDDDSPWLMSFVDYAKRRGESPRYIKAMGASCVLDSNLPAKKYQQLLKSTPTKEATWWLYFGAVRPDAVKAVDFNVNGVFEPYSFEAHGRAALERYGFSAPSAAAQAQIPLIVQPAHPLEHPKALVFCEDPDKAPKVVIRGGGGVRAFEILSKAIFVGPADRQAAELQAWVATHQAELMSCWERAVELFYEAYPDRARIS